MVLSQCVDLCLQVAISPVQYVGQQHVYVYASSSARATDADRCQRAIT
jgi:hypothetical protein